MGTHIFRRFRDIVIVLVAVGLFAPRPAFAATEAPDSPIYHIKRAAEKLELVVNSSRILMLDQSVPRIQVNNPEIVIATALSPNQIQIWAKKTGVTQVNLWDDKQQIYTVDVVVVGDARELAELLNAEFPQASIKVRPIASGVLVSGYVDAPQDVDRIKALAEEYYPKVITNITVAGVQQILLHVKVLEISRTKARNMGFDWTQISGTSFVNSSVSGIISGVPGGVAAATGPQTLGFNVVDGGSSFFGVLNAFCQNDLAAVVSEPNLVTTSGRPAYFSVGGELPYTVSQGFGAMSIEWKKYGTKVSVVPFVLGNGRIRLEVRPEVSSIDKNRTEIAGVPAIKTNEVDTGVELGAGQTLAIAGLVQTRREAKTRGIPLVMDVPYLGALFRQVSSDENEIESLALVTPEFVQPVDAAEFPRCGPGSRSTAPGDWDLYMKGKIEVANPCPPCNGNCPTIDPDLATPPGTGPQTGRGLASANHESSQAGDRPIAVASRPARDNRHNPSSPQARSSGGSTGTKSGEMPGFRGPIGYDASE